MNTSLILLNFFCSNNHAQTDTFEPQLEYHNQYYLISPLFICGPLCFNPIDYLSVRTEYWLKSNYIIISRKIGTRHL